MRRKNLKVLELRMSFFLNETSHQNRVSVSYEAVS